MKSDNSCLQLSGYQVLHPFSNEVKFEKFIVDVFNSIDKTNTYSQFGRRGQKQHGFDVSSIETKTVIQCKLKIIDRDDYKIRQELLKELDDDFSDFKIFNSDNEFYFSKFIFASTFKNDTHIQIECKKKSTDKIVVDYWCWDRIMENLTEDLLTKYYRDFIKPINDYYGTEKETDDEHIGIQGISLKSNISESTKASVDKQNDIIVKQDSQQKWKEKFQNCSILDRIHSVSHRFYPLNILKQNTIPDLYPFNENLNPRHSQYINRFSLQLANDEIAGSLKKWNDEQHTKPSQHVKEVFSFLQNNLINSISGIAVKEFNIHHEESKCQCSLCVFDNLDLRLLDERITSNSISENNSIQDKLENAYLSFKTLNLKDAYLQISEILNSVSNEQDQEKRRITRFICSSNLQNLYWLYRNARQDSESREILIELKNQNPYKYLVEENTDEYIKIQLEYIYNGKFIKDASYKIDKALIEIKKSVDINRNVQFHIEDLIYHIGYLYSFIRKNYLFYDLYDDFRVIVEKAIDGIFAAYSVQENIPPNSFFGSYKKISINEFLLNLCTFYCETKNLIYIIKRYKIINLQINTDTIIDRAINLCKSPELFDKYNNGNEFREMYRTYDHVFENLMFLISASENNPATEKLFSAVINLLKHSKSRFSLAGFKHLLAEKRKFIKHDDLLTLLDIALKQHKYDEDLLNKIVWIWKQEYPNRKVSDITVVNEALESENKKAFFFLWFISTNKLKSKIQDRITISLENKFNFTNYIYCSLNNIIPYESFLSNALEYIKKSNKKGLYEKVGNSYIADDYNDFNYLVQLIYTFNIKIPEEYLVEFEQYSDYHKFILNPEGFEYSNFKIEWLFVFQRKVYWEKFRKIEELKKTVSNELNKNFSNELAEIFHKYLK